ncbi:MAG: hypothetical protein HSCHL_1311 [Hydrogenibacillus schlegelii]|uniref:Uncharacterized protein n=1 Tax=Hydrogenibacillus schlegelii TaxID=1484 RepID=A0A2T5G5U8_HYDSH|nr:MAG: hypothetical protein HSCHL_1311 [Hydrogenibacillus schlegelii]
MQRERLRALPLGVVFLLRQIFHLEPVQRPVVQPGSFGRISFGLLFADVEKDRTGSLSRVRIVQPDDDRLFARLGMDEDVFPAGLPEGREFIARPVQGVGKGAALTAFFLAVHEQATRIALAAFFIIKGALRRQVGRAQAGQGDVLDRRIVLILFLIPQHKLLNQVFSAFDFQRLLINDPLRHEGALRPVGADRSVGVPKFVVHKERKRAVAVVVSAEAVGDPDHPVRLPVLPGDRVPDGQKRLDLDAVHRRHEVRRLRAARPAVWIIFNDGDKEGDRIRGRGADGHNPRVAVVFAVNGQRDAVRPLRKRDRRLTAAHRESRINVLADGLALRIGGKDGHRRRRHRALLDVGHRKRHRFPGVNILGHRRAFTGRLRLRRREAERRHKRRDDERQHQSHRQRPHLAHDSVSHALAPPPPHFSCCPAASPTLTSSQPVRRKPLSLSAPSPDGAGPPGAWRCRVQFRSPSFATVVKADAMPNPP